MISNTTSLSFSALLHGIVRTTSDTPQTTNAATSTRLENDDMMFCPKAFGHDRERQGRAYLCVRDVQSHNNLPQHERVDGDLDGDVGYAGAAHVSVQYSFASSVRVP